MTQLTALKVFMLLVAVPYTMILYKIIKGMYYALLARSRTLSNIRASRDTALVFGASSGIGRAFSLALARRGFNVVVVARRQAQLLELKKEIEALGVGCEVFCCDAAVNSEIDSLFDHIYPKYLGVAVYASGVCNKVPAYLEDLDDSETYYTISVNVTGMVRFSAHAARIMKANGGGLICLFSSETGLYPSPMMTVYGGTKAFTANFATALSEECKSHGVSVIAAAPFWVASEMTMTARTSWRMAGAAPFVERLLAGNFREVVINPWWSHKLLAIPLASRFGVQIQHRGMLFMREKVLRKLKRMEDADTTKNQENPHR